MRLYWQNIETASVTRGPDYHSLFAYLQQLKFVQKLQKMPKLGQSFVILW